MGAATEPELKERKAKVEDALAATRAAIDEGIVPGGGVAYVRAMPALDKLQLDADEAVAIPILKAALVEPIRIIAHNAGQDGPVVLDKVTQNESANYGYDAATDEYGDLLEKGIVDPAKVCRVALENAASVAA